MVRSLEEIVAWNTAVAAAACPTPPTFYGVVQQGGTTWELYVATFNTEEAAQTHRQRCGDSTYNTGAVFQLTPSVWDSQREQWLFTEQDVMDSVQHVLQSLGELGHA